jgi:hypothetical protein
MFRCGRDGRTDSRRDAGATESYGSNRVQNAPEACGKRSKMHILRAFHRLVPHVSRGDDAHPPHRSLSLLTFVTFT